MNRKFLGVFWLPVPQPEHAKIIEVLKSASKGDCKQVFAFGDVKKGATLGVLFTCDSKPWHVDFSRVLLNEDKYLLIEVGDLSCHFGLGIAETWLRSHPGPQISGADE